MHLLLRTPGCRNDLLRQQHWSLAGNFLHPRVAEGRDDICLRVDRAGRSAGKGKAKAKASSPRAAVALSSAALWLRRSTTMDDPCPGDLANLMPRYLGCTFMGADEGMKSLPFLQSSVVFKILLQRGEYRLWSWSARGQSLSLMSYFTRALGADPHHGEGSEAPEWERTCSRSQAGVVWVR